MKIDITKKYRTLDGRDVRIHATDGPNEKRPVIGSIHNNQGDYWWIFDCTDLGKYADPEHGESPLDLIEIREPREWEIVVSTEANRSYKPGTIDGKATDDLQGGDKRIPSDTWEIIRVREIL